MKSELRERLASAEGIGELLGEDISFSRIEAIPVNIQMVSCFALATSSSLSAELFGLALIECHASSCRHRPLGPDPRLPATLPCASPV